MHTQILYVHLVSQDYEIDLFVCMEIIQTKEWRFVIHNCQINDNLPNVVNCMCKCAVRLPVIHFRQGQLFWLCSALTFFLGCVQLQCSMRRSCVRNTSDIPMRVFYLETQADKSLPVWIRFDYLEWQKNSHKELHSQSLTLCHLLSWLTWSLGNEIMIYTSYSS